MLSFDRAKCLARFAIPSSQLIRSDSKSVRAKSFSPRKDPTVAGRLLWVPLTWLWENKIPTITSGILGSSLPDAACLSVLGCSTILSCSAGFLLSRSFTRSLGQQPSPVVLAASCGQSQQIFSYQASLGSHSYFFLLRFSCHYSHLLISFILFLFLFVLPFSIYPKPVSCSSIVFHLKMSVET